MVDRFAQIEPAVLLAVDGYTYNGKDFSRTEVVAEIAAQLPTLRAVVMVDLLGTAQASPPAVARDRPGARLGGPGRGRVRAPKIPSSRRCRSSTRLWVVYSSGTTGLPKPIVHGHGGVVLEHVKALALHLDLHPGDRFTWYTTTGWMMWNFLVGGLLAGTTIVLYDGSAGYPQTGRLWQLAADEKLTYLGVGAPYLMTCEKAGLKPGEAYDLSALRGIGSTGSPLPPEGFTWVYRCVKKDLQLGSFSGGTDVCTGFVGPNPLLPVRAGVISGRCLGAKVESFDSRGHPVTGRVGELVITEPMPSMPVMFWNDPGGKKYRDSYFADFPGVWRHGDWIEILPDGACVIYGRSDATLNRGGVRMGTSEFYRVVESFPEIADSLVVDTGRLGEDGLLVLFVQLCRGRKSWTTTSPAGSEARCASSCLPGTSLTRSSACQGCRAPCRARSWKSRYARSCWARRRRKPRTPARSLTRTCSHTSAGGSGGSSLRASTARLALGCREEASRTRRERPL